MKENFIFIGDIPLSISSKNMQRELIVEMWLGMKIEGLDIKKEKLDYIV